MVTKDNIFPLDAAKKHTGVETRLHTSAPSCHDGPAALADADCDDNFAHGDFPRLMNGLSRS
jgi:hypothetical protein